MLLTGYQELWFYYSKDNEEAGTDNMYARVIHSDGETENITLYPEGNFFYDSDRKYYSVGVPFAAKDYDDIISIQLFHNADPCSDKVTRSVEMYLKTLAENTLVFDAETCELADAILTYCKYAKGYFAHRDGDDSLLATELISTREYVLKALESYPKTVYSGDLMEGLTYVGMSLSLESGILSRFYFAKSDSIGHTMDGYNKELDLYYMQGRNVIAELGDTATIRYYGYQISYCPLNYIRLALEREEDEELTKVCIALFDCYEAAKRYQNPPIEAP